MCTKDVLFVRLFILCLPEGIMMSCPNMLYLRVCVRYFLSYFAHHIPHLPCFISKFTQHLHISLLLLLQAPWPHKGTRQTSPTIPPPPSLVILPFTARLNTLMASSCISWTPEHAAKPYGGAASSLQWKIKPLHYLSYILFLSPSMPLRCPAIVHR